MHLDEGDLDLAATWCEKAIDVDGNSSQALELRGVISLEKGDLEEAREWLLRAVDIDPEEGFTKFMYLGQISHGEVAVGYFNTGIHLMCVELDAAQHGQAEEGEIHMLREQLTAAYCTLAEQYLTDLW